MPAEHWNSNWKLAVENGIESYHLFKVHKETLEPMTPTKQAYYIAGSAEWTLTGGVMKDTRSKLTQWLSGDYPEAYNHYQLLFLPPSLIAVISYDGINWIQIIPEGSEHCAVIAGGLIEHKVTNFNAPEFQFTQAFLTEDRVLCERLQKGMHARKSKGGKLVSMGESSGGFSSIPFQPTVQYDTGSLYINRACPKVYSINFIVKYSNHSLLGNSL